MKVIYAYAVIRKDDSLCVQINQSNKPNWVLNNDSVFNISVDPSVCLQCGGKYYYDNQWYSRTWNEYKENEFGEMIPVIESGYIDTPWSPINGGEVNV